jgi:hypothetical protein
MTGFYLSEAYSDIYDHRKVEELDDNLRFIDYMLDEDIEQVVESLVWEFRDYGNTLDESFDLLTYSASNEVISESYDQIIEDILTEATVTYGRGDVLANKAKADALAKRSKDKSDARTAQATAQRRETRRARVDGAISKVKAAMAGAKGGMGRASKALGGAASDAAKKGRNLVSSAAQKGKALLGRLLRKGASMAGKAISGAGKNIQRSGETAASATRAERTVRVPGGEFVRDAGGSKRTKVGRAVRKVGVALQRMGKGPKDKPAEKEAPKMKALPPARPETETRRAAVQRKLDTASKGTTGSSRVGSPAPTLALPAKTSGKPAVQREISQRKKQAAAKLQKAASGSTTRGTRFAGPNAKLSSTRTNTGYKERLAKFASKLNEEDYETLIDYIIEDIISSGYALDEMTALDILENLTEDTVADIALEYLND